MIKLDFSGPFDSHITVGPAPRFTIEGATIFSEPRHRRVACLCENNQWEVSGRFYTRYDADGALQVCLMDGEDEEPAGPFGSVFAVGNVKYADHQHLASFDHREQCWRSPDLNRCWLGLLLVPAKGRH